MDILFILVKLFIITYILIKYFLTETTSPVYIILYLLIYICINMIYYISNNKLLKKIITLFTLFFLIYGYIYINKSFILFLPINFYELCLNMFPSYINLFVLFISLFILNKSIVSEYILISLLTYLLFTASLKVYNRMNKFKDENDNMRKRIDALYKKLNINEEYQKQVMYTTQLEERNRISQKIHDDVGHTISGSLMQLEAAKILIDKDKDNAIAMIQNTINVLRNGLNSIRMVLRDIKPPEDKLGISRLKLLLNEFMSRSHIECHLFVNGNLDKINYIYWNIIIENIKELLTNVLVYSKATNVSVKIDILNKFIKVEVKDNGVGAKSIKKGLGLKGIEERTSSVKGQVIIDGSNGFSVISLLPRGDI